LGQVHIMHLLCLEILVRDIQSRFVLQSQIAMIFMFQD